MSDTRKQYKEVRDLPIKDVVYDYLNEGTQKKKNLAPFEERTQQELYSIMHFRTTRSMMNQQKDDRKEKANIVKSIEDRIASQDPSITPRHYLVLASLSKDDKRQFDCLKVAEEAKLPEAYFNLGVYYSHSKVNQDEKTALKYYEQAASNGSMEGIMELGCIYQKNNDYAKSVECFAKLSESEHCIYSSLSFVFLGMLYLKGGHGITKDEKKAEEYFNNAAKMKHVGSSRMLSDLYAKGEGRVLKDVKKAALHYRIAALMFPSAPDNLKKLQGENKDDAEVNYHASMVFNDAKQLQTLFQNQPDLTYKLFLADHGSSMPESFRQQACKMMTQVFTKEEMDNLPERHQVRAKLVIDAFEQKNTEGLRRIFNLNPEWLSPDDNFQIGFHCYNFSIQENKEFANTIIVNLLSFYDRIRLSAADKERALREITYLHLRESAMKGSDKARHLLIQIVSSESAEVRNLLFPVVSPGQVRYQQLPMAESMSFPTTYENFRDSFIKFSNELKKQNEAKKKETTSAPLHTDFFKSTVVDFSAVEEEKFAEDTLKKIQLLFNPVWYKAVKSPSASQQNLLKSLYSNINPGFDIDVDIALIQKIRNEIEDKNTPPFLCALNKKEQDDIKHTFSEIKKLADEAISTYSKGHKLR